MKISIIIPNYNGQKLLEKNLPEVEKLKTDEIIVVDDASTDNSLGYLSEKHKENLSNAKKGKIPLCVFTRRSYKGKNNPMYGVHRFGEKSPSWRGGRVKDKYGYILIYKPNHPFAMYKKYVYEHRLIIEKQIGRYLKSTEIVHHINSNCSDNRIENLKLFSSNIEHLNYHKYLK